MEASKYWACCIDIGNGDIEQVSDNFDSVSSAIEYVSDHDFTHEGRLIRVSECTCDTAGKTVEVRDYNHFEVVMLVTIHRIPNMSLSEFITVCKQHELVNCEVAEEIIRVLEDHPVVTDTGDVLAP